MSTLRVDRHDRVLVLTLDDAEKRNALSGALVAEIVSAVDEAESDDTIGAVVVTGAPPAFCAGADLGDLGKASGDGLRAIYEGFLRVARCRLPTVAAVNGAAVGAGMNLALSCDVRLAGRSARFDTRFLQLGLHPGGGHTWLLTRAVGPATAKAMVLFGEVLDGEAAAARGLAWRCVDDERLVDDAVSLAARAASAPRELSVRAAATMRRMPSVATHEEAVDIELDAQLWSLAQPFFRERLAAMRARVTGR